MDLSRWMQPTAEHRPPETLSWQELPWPADDPGVPGSRWIRLERCMGAEDARRLAVAPATLAVYCVTPGGAPDSPEVAGIEPWGAESASLDPDAREWLVAVVWEKGEGAERTVELAGATEPAPAAVDRVDEADNGGDGDHTDAVSSPIQSVPSMWSTPSTSSTASFRSVVSSAPSVPSAPSPEIALRLRGPLSPGPDRVAWCEDLPRLYAERWDGENPVDLLPWLWFDGAGAGRLRLRLRLLLAELARDRVVHPQVERCRAAGTRLALAVDVAGSPVAEALWSAGPAQRLFALADAPSLIEAADLATAEADDVALGVREAVSAARQLGLTDVVDEIFDGRGAWPNPLAVFRARAERRLALGATRLAGRPVPESPLGDGKREAGPCAPALAQGWQEGWTELCQALERLRDVLSQGTRRTAILVLAPSESVMALAATPLPAAFGPLARREGPGDAQAARVASDFVSVLEALQAFQMDFDLGDEDLIERHGKTQANAFWVGEAEYTVVVVPPALTWRESTLRLLRRFVRKGGSVVAVRPVAPLVGFEARAGIEALAEEYPNVYLVDRAGRDVCFQIQRIEPRLFQVRAAGQESVGLLLQHRRTDSHDLYFVANPSPDRSIEGLALMRGSGAVRVLDAWGPRLLLKDTDDERGFRSFHFNFHASTGVLFVVGGEADLTEPPHQRRPHATSTVALSEEWEFGRLDPNTLPLRACRATLDGQALAAAAGPRGEGGLAPVEWVRAALRDQWRGLSSLCREDDGTAEKPSVSPAQAPVKDSIPEPHQLAMTFPFESRIDFAGSRLTLVVEPAPGLEVRINGESVALSSPAAWPLTECLEADVSGLVREGTNEVELRLIVEAGSRCAGVEPPILAGDFAVALDEQGRALLAAEPERLRNGAWAEQGYPYYAGRMAYRTLFDLTPEPRKRYFVSVRGAVGALVTAQVGEHAAAPLHHAPHRLEITRLVRPGGDFLEIVVAATLWNLYGPVQTLPKAWGAGPVEPRVYDEAPWSDRRLWSRRAMLQAVGLLEGAAIETYDPDAPPPTPANAGADSELPTDAAALKDDAAVDVAEPREDAD